MACALTTADTTARRWRLRVNVLEQCQLRCAYCLPGSVKRFEPRAHWLDVGDYRLLARAARALPLDRVRFTGGEPLLREALPDVARAFRDALPDVDLAVTTNGQRLAERLDELHAAGIRRVNVHVDTLRAERYRQLMGEGAPQRALDAALAARRAGWTVKLNVVAQARRNDDELGDFLDWSGETGVEVRFIELMNTGSAAAFAQRHFLSGAQVLTQLSGERGPITALPRHHPADPAARFRTAGGVVFGLIASDTQPFCAACDRLRLSVDGRLRGCMYEPSGLPLHALLQAGDEHAVAAALRDASRRKQSAHPLTARPRARFSMAELGG